MKQLSPTYTDIERWHDAGEWVQRLAESSDPELAERWARWCDASPRNLESFEQMQRVWLGLAGPKASSVASPRAAVRTRRRALIGMAASVTVMIAGCIWGALHYYGSRAFDTAIGEQRRVVLVDGSFVDLAPDSRLSVRFTPWRRDLRLERGEAFFSVANESSRPFVVQANGLEVTAGGRAFDVRMGAADTLITVSEGRVIVASSTSGTAAAGAVVAGVGQRVIFSGSEQRLSVASVEPMVAGSWRSGTLQFLGEPLEEVVNEINRYGQRKIIVASAFRETLFTGTIAPANVDDWLKALEQIYAVEVVDRDEAIHIQSRVVHGA